MKLISIRNCPPVLWSTYIRFYFCLFYPLIMGLIKLKNLLCILNPLGIQHIRLLSKMDLSFRCTCRFQNHLTWWNCLYYFLFDNFWRLFYFIYFIFKLVRSICHLVNNLKIVSILIILFIIFNWLYKLNLLSIIYNFCLI